MKTILLSLLTISALSADVVQSTEIQLDGWYADASGNFQNNGSVIDLKERGHDNKIAPSISVDFNGESSYKNFKLIYTHIEQDSTKVLSEDIQHNGVNFDEADISKSTLNLDIMDAIYYVDVEKDDGYELDLGLGVRYVTGSYQTKVCVKDTTTDFDILTPIGYAKLNITPAWLPVIWTSQLIVSPVNNLHIDARTSLKKEVVDNLNLEIGYRINKYDAEDGYTADIDLRGAYLGASYKF